MATLAADHDEARTNAGPPISTHPAFPAIVALWFAALLGLGSLILPTALLERLTEVTGLSSIVPSAAAPLGFTARAGIAIGGAILGAVLGLVLARQVAAGQAPRPRARFSDDMPRRRPISAHDELGEEGLDAPPPRAVAGKRRSLAIAEDDAPSRYLSPVPLPGHDAASGETAEAPLELAEYVEPCEPPAAQEDQDLSMSDEPPFDPAETHVPEPAERQEFAPPPTGAGMPRAFDPLPEPDEEDELGEAFDALPFAPPSLRRAQAAENAAASPPIPLAYEPAAEPAVRLEAVGEDSFDEPDEFEHGAEEGPLERLGLVQLATRLGSAIERRRAWRAAAPAEGPAARPVFAAEEEFDAAEADEAARARADFFGAPARSAPAEPRPERASGLAAASRAPAPLATIDFGDDDDSEAEDLAASFSLPLRKRSATVAAAAVPDAYAAAEDEGEEGEDATADQEYSSLLAMKNPFRKEEEFVRVEEPEPDEDEIEATVTFPERKEASIAPARPFDPPADAAARGGTAARKPGDAERELRAALETLQRMSGAA